MATIIAIVGSIGLWATYLFLEKKQAVNNINDETGDHYEDED